MSAIVSASGVERMLACPASVVLPRAISTTRYADRGTGLHGYVRAVSTGTPPEQALSTLDAEARRTAVAIDFTKIADDLTDVRCESAYALNVDARSARFLGTNIGRAYPKFGLTERDVPGSDDIEGTRRDGVPVVVDLKFGWERVTECEDNAQMKAYATFRMLVEDAPAVEARIAYVRPGGAVYADAHEFSSFDLDSFVDEVHEGLARVAKARRIFDAGGMPNVYEGKHCKYCPSAHACPAKITLARRGLLDLEDIEGRVTSMTLEERGAAWNKVKAIMAIADRVKDALSVSAHADWLPTSPGKVLKPISYPVERFDVAAALEMLRGHGASESDIASLYKVAIVDKLQECNDPRVPKAARKRKKAA